MKEFNLNKIEAEMRKQRTITDKLNYWLTIKEKHLDGHNLKDLFGYDYKVISSIYIPEKIYNEHFKSDLDNPEYTYWMLKYEAEIYFDLLLKFLKKNYSKPEIEAEYIKSELKRLNDFEEEASRLFIAKAFNIYSANSPVKHWRAFELKRIHAGYYEKFAGTHVETAKLFADHILYKKYLEDRLKGLRIKDEISLTQIEFALICVYEKMPITSRNLKGVPKIWHKTESLQKIQRFIKEYRSEKNRQRSPHTLTKIENMIARIKLILPRLTVGKKQAEKDLEVLRIRLKTKDFE